MKKWISEYVFLVDAVVCFLFTIVVYMNELIGMHLWIKVLFWCFMGMIFYLDRLKKSKIKYTIDSYGFWAATIVVLLFIFVINSAMELFEKNTFLYFLLISPFWKIGFLLGIEELLNHRNYVNGIEVEKYDFWSQDERKKKKQEKREEKKRRKDKNFWSRDEK